jgi:uncharacterized BrkB/YihY/UPF0761 family membrane protein
MKKLTGTIFLIVIWYLSAWIGFELFRNYEQVHIENIWQIESKFKISYELASSYVYTFIVLFGLVYILTLAIITDIIYKLFLSND